MAAMNSNECELWPFWTDSLDFFCHAVIDQIHADRKRLEGANHNPTEKQGPGSSELPVLSENHIRA